MKKNRTLLWAGGAVLALVAAAIVSQPYIPSQVAFDSADDEAMKKYESIVAAHGHSYRYDRNFRGERTIVVDSISAREYRKIDCDFFAWDSSRKRSQGVIVYDRPECAL